MATPKTIVLKGESGKAYVTKEGLAGGTITPGYLVEQYDDTTVQKFQAHGTADGAAQKMFAYEHETVGGDIDDDYVTGDRLKYVVCQPGVEIYALVPASAPAIVHGDPLGSVGDGTLKKVTVSATTLANSIVGYAMENVDNSGGGSEARIRIEVA